MSLRFLVPVLALALGGCATELAWPPAVQRLPEGAAGPIAPVKPVGMALTHEEIVALARSGAPASLIIQKMRDSRATYSATPEQAGSLIAQGVPPEVLSYMQYGEAGIAPRPVPAPGYAYPPSYPYPYYGPSPYGYWGLGIGYSRWYPRSSLHFGIGRRW